MFYVWLFLFLLSYSVNVRDQSASINHSHHITSYSLISHCFFIPFFLLLCKYYDRFFLLFITVVVVVVVVVAVVDDVIVVVVDRRSPEEEDDLSEVRADAVPPEVRAWLASTFTRQISTLRKPGEPDKPKFRSVANAIRAGIFVERIYRRMSSSSFLQFPPEVARNLKVRSLRRQWFKTIFFFFLNASSLTENRRRLNHFYHLLSLLMMRVKYSPFWMSEIVARLNASFWWRLPFTNSSLYYKSTPLTYFCITISRQHFPCVIKSQFSEAFQLHNMLCVCTRFG